MLTDHGRSPTPTSRRAAVAERHELTGHAETGEETGAEPARQDPTGRWATRRRSLVVRVAIALVVAAALSSQSLVTTAERLGYGPRRTIALSAATVWHEQAGAVGLDRPAGLLRSVAGRQPPARPPAAGEAGSANGAFGPTRADLERTPTTAGPGDPTPGGSDPLAGPSRSASTAPASAAPATTVPPEPSARAIGPGDELRIWAGGDSLGEYVGNHLLAALADPELVSVELDYRISTGLARPDYFDWPAQVAWVTATEPPPDALIFMVGGNDDQNMRRADGVVDLGTDDWYDEYEARVASIVDAVDPDRTRVYWIGLPPMRDTDRHEVSMGMNAVVRRVAATRPHVTFVDIEPQFSGPDGGYRPHIAAPDGELRLARQADGVHITFAGSTWVADMVWELIDEDWAIAESANPDHRPPDPRTVPR